MTWLLLALGLGIAVLAIGVLWLIAALGKLIFNRSAIDFDDMSLGLEEEDI
jgi:prepilin signal peptidase PulO-like enzyme (type II secretory pathway)